MKAPMDLEVRVPAKINLWLEVIRKRSDGYHDLSSLMLPIGVFDYIRLYLSGREGISIECGYPGIPTDGSNLACRAAGKFLDCAGIKTGIHIEIGKNIPAGAGLGGGSADAAAVLLGLNLLFSKPLTPWSLHEVARTLGADVPFFLYQHAALATGIGDNLERVDGIPPYPLVLVKPPLTISTQGVYKSLKLTRGASRITVNGLLANPWQLYDVVENDLEAVTLSEYPLLSRLKGWMLEQGALGAAMSGSGSTIFGVFPSRSQAEKVGIAANRDWADCWVTVTEVIVPHSEGP